MRSEFKALNDGSASVRLKLRMEGDNFNSTQASYISGSWQKDPNQNNSEMRRIDSWQMNNSYEKPNNEYHFNRDWINP
jgi:hypothetical protein